MLFFTEHVRLGRVEIFSLRQKEGERVQRCHRSKEAGNLEVSSNCLDLRLTSPQTYYLKYFELAFKTLWAYS